MRIIFPTLTLFIPTLALAAEPRNVADAPLNAVQFVDRNEGWAVGAEGVILHTIDGGQTWERQASGVRATLQALHFLTPYTGWVVGREEIPYGGSVAVILATKDGGLKWTRLGMNQLPGMNCIRFFDENNGVVAGDGTDLFPSGVFTTNNGGRNWQPVKGPRVDSCVSGAFSN